MILYQAGDRSVAICERCKGRVNTTMEYCDYTPTGWDTTVRDVLVAVCDGCRQIVGVPHQSTPKINESRKKQSEDLESIEARVPRAIQEAIDLMAAALGGEPKTIRPAILRYYLSLVAEDPTVAEAVKESSTKGLARGDASGRISLKVHRQHWEPAWIAARGAGIASKSELVRGIGVLAADDFQIHTQNRPEVKISRASKIRQNLLKKIAKSIPC